MDDKLSDSIESIKEELINHSCILTNVLRKAKILAQRIKLDEFKKWIQDELEGYDTSLPLPEYRKLMATNLGTFSGPFQSMVKNMVIPTYDLPDSVRDFAESLQFYDGIGGLEAMLETDSDSLRRAWPQEAIILARESTKLSGGMVLVAAHTPIPKHAIAGILDTVKNKLLDFVIDLEDIREIKEKEGTPELSNDEKRQIFQVNIYGGKNIVSSGNYNTSNITMVNSKDIDSLKSYLNDNGIPEEDIKELSDIIIKEPNMKKDSLPLNFNTWLGNLLAKTASGVLNIGMEVLPQMIFTGLSNYYGW